MEINALETIDEWIDEFEKIGLQDKVKEYSQVPQIVMDILDKSYPSTEYSSLIVYILSK